MNDHLAAGYDILVWIDDDGDVVCKGYTPDGHSYLRTIIPDLEQTQIMVVEAHPEEFKARAPQHLRIGLVQYHTKQVVEMAKSRLH